MAKMEIEKDELADKLRHATNQLSEVQVNFLLNTDDFLGFNFQKNSIKIIRRMKNYC